MALGATIPLGGLTEGSDVAVAVHLTSVKPRSRRVSSCLWTAVVWWLEMNLHASNSACRTVSPQSFDDPPAWNRGRHVKE